MELQRERLKKQEQAIWQLTESVGKLKVMCDEGLKEKEQQEKTLSRVLDQLRDQKKHQSKFEKVSLSPKYSSRHFIFHRKCVSLIWVIRFHSSHHCFLGSAQKPFFSQPDYSSW